MSSKNRGSQSVESDAYYTPLKSFNPLLPFLPKDKKIWEPSCGDSRLIKRMNEYGLVADGDDLNNGYNFLEDRTKRECLVGNPPYSIAKAFVTHALSVSDDVYFLLRLSFLESKERKGFWQKNTPSRLFILSERPNFIMHVKCKNRDCKTKRYIPIESERPKTCHVCGGKVSITTSDSSSYCYFHWNKNEKYDQFIHWL